MPGVMRRWFVKKSKLKPGFSIICAYNNRKKLNDYLIKSLSKQTAHFEVLTIDNTENRLKSAPVVLNETARKAKYEYLMFVHQDVALESSDWLANAFKDLKSLSDLGAAGVAGKGEKGFAASVTHGNPPLFVGPERLAVPVEVQTLDGCLMIVKKKIFEKISFDEKTIEGWYLYVVDYCLDLIRLGYKNYVLPCQIYHESTGPGDFSLTENTLKNIIKKYKNQIELIYTTVGDWNTKENR